MGKRISNFLLWQIAYSELHFTDVFWPSFSKSDLYEAIESYQYRRRRYGGDSCHHCGRDSYRSPSVVVDAVATRGVSGSKEVSNQEGHRTF